MKWKLIILKEFSIHCAFGNFLRLFIFHMIDELVEGGFGDFDDVFISSFLSSRNKNQDKITFLNRKNTNFKDRYSILFAILIFVFTIIHYFIFFYFCQSSLQADQERVAVTSLVRRVTVHGLAAEWREGTVQIIIPTLAVLMFYKRALLYGRVRSVWDCNNHFWYFFNVSNSFISCHENQWKTFPTFLPWKIFPVFLPWKIFLTFLPWKIFLTFLPWKIFRTLLPPSMPRVA